MILAAYPFRSLTSPFRSLTVEDLPVVLGLVTLGQTAQTPADPAQRHLADEPAMGWQWGSAMPSPPPGLVRPNWGLLPVESQRAHAWLLLERVCAGGCSAPLVNAPQSYALSRPLQDHLGEWSGPELVLLPWDKSPLGLADPSQIARSVKNGFRHASWDAQGRRGPG